MRDRGPAGTRGARGVDAERQAVLVAYRDQARRFYGYRSRLLRSAASSLLDHSLYAISSALQPVRPEATAVLFLHFYPGAVERLRRLTDLLRSRGLSVAHEVFSRGAVLRGRKLTRPKALVHPRLIIPAAHARYLVDRYRPRVLVTLENGGVISPFLRAAMAEIGGVYVNLSHGVTSCHPGHSMTDFDYYFLFGRTSLSHLLENPLRLGSTRAVLSGSPFLAVEDLAVPPVGAERRHVLFFSTHIPPGERFDYFRRAAVTTVNWARSHPEYELSVKLHPVEDPGFIRAISTGTPNVRVLPPETTVGDAMRGTSLVIHSLSNAGLEAAIAGRPSVIVNDSTEPDQYLHIEEYFQPRAATVAELHARVETVLADYPAYVARCVEFHRAHIERLDSIDFICDCLMRLYRGEELEGVEVPENLRGLARPEG